MDGKGTTAEELGGMARLARMMASAGQSVDDVLAYAELVASTARTWGEQ